MSWVTIIWAMIASACCTLALMHMLVWWRRRDALDNLLFTLSAVVRLYLRAGRMWLAWTVCGLRTLSLVLNFVFTPNLNYREITASYTFPSWVKRLPLPRGTLVDDVRS